MRKTPSHRANAARRGRNPRGTAAGGTAAGREILGALSDLAEVLRLGEAEQSRFTVRHVEVAEPGAYDKGAVLRTRERVGASQQVFARMMGVSLNLVQSWEQGTRKPAAYARRLMDLMNDNPEAWARVVKPKSHRPGGAGGVAAGIGFDQPPPRRVKHA
jgi:DNA-binding transcriptional regulator YiaG